MNAHNMNVTDTIVEALELPKDVVCGMPLFYACGNRELYIDNHKGILNYQSDFIVMKTKSCLIRIEGKELCIAFFSHDTVKITGQICKICFVS